MLLCYAVVKQFIKRLEQCQERPAHGDKEDTVSWVHLAPRLLDRVRLRLRDHRFHLVVRAIVRNDERLSVGVHLVELLDAVATPARRL